MSSVVEWLEKNTLMAYKDVFEVQVDDLEDLSREVLKNDEEIIAFIEEEIGEKKKLKKTRILNAIKKLQETEKISVGGPMGQEHSSIERICQQMEIKTKRGGNELSQIEHKLQITKQKLDNELESNRSESECIRLSIDSTERKVDGLNNDLAQHESTLLNLSRQVDDLENDIRRKEREIKTAKLRTGVTTGSVGVAGSAAGVVFGIFTLGLADLIIIPAVATSLSAILADRAIVHKKLQDQKTSLINVKNIVANEMIETRHLKELKETEKNSLIREKRRLKKEQTKLAKESKELGQKIVTISNVMKNLREERIQCGQLMYDIDMIKELADIDLTE